MKASPRVLPVQIAGMGCYLPSRVVTSADLERDLSLPAGWIERGTGVCSRRWRTDETTAGMAAAAIRDALRRAGKTIDDLDLIVSASTAPQQAIPCTAALIQRELGAPEGRSTCFDVNATCLSFVSALHVVAPMVAAGVYRCAAIVSSEINSGSLNFDEPESAVLFGDAAAAAILVPAGEGQGAINHSRMETFSGGADLAVILGGGTLHHPNDPATSPAMNTFHMDGPAIFRFATRIAIPFVDRFLGELGWARDDFDLVVPHQASGHGVAAISRWLGFPHDRVVANLPERGNCIAASIPLALAEADHAGRMRRGDRILLIGTGAGVSIAAAALTW